jgi:hypothetical protein
MPNKELLISEPILINLSSQQLLENSSNISGKFVVKSILQKANTKNANKRIYSKEVLEREIDKYIVEFVELKKAYGELDHSEEMVVELKNVAINIMDIWWEGDTVWGDVEVLNTPSGKIVQELLKSGLTVGISSRGQGSVNTIDEETSIVGDNFELLCFDVVSNPSTPGAYFLPKSLHEGVEREKIINSYGTINEMIGEILCRNIGFCSCQLTK